jgi:hypothetical protein
MGIFLQVAIFMKFFVLRHSKNIVGLCLVIFVLFIAFFNLFGYLFGIKYISVVQAVAEVNRYQVRSELMMEAMNSVGVSSPEAAVEVWANGLMMRSAAMQYAVLGRELRQEYARQLEKTFPNWVTGVSSPWVDGYKITKVDKRSDTRTVINLQISTMTSTGPAGDYKALLTVDKEDGFWRITQIKADKEFRVYTGFQ